MRNMYIWLITHMLNIWKENTCVKHTWNIYKTCVINVCETYRVFFHTFHIREDTYVKHMFSIRKTHVAHFAVYIDWNWSVATQHIFCKWSASKNGNKRNNQNNVWYWFVSYASNKSNCIIMKMFDVCESALL